MTSPATPDRSSTGTPRWVKVSAALAIALALLFAGLMLFGSEGHGPERHTPDTETGQDQGQETTPEDTDDDHEPSQWDH